MTGAFILGFITGTVSTFALLSYARGVIRAKGR